MKMSEIAALTDEQLVHTELSLERKLIDARIKKSFGTLEDSSVFAKIRKDIARIQTESTSREKKQGLAKNALKAQFRKTFVATNESEESGGNFLQDIADKLS
ncbi:MAG: 50S ribosomal protein L29 [Deltaproteobacteria bacterium]|nr:50S ribosomal protein L29 [Deltaproteobacteria bacterium]